MRLWSIHPKYLDTIGLIAFWRETLLARNVLLGKTKGYKNHPQLIRFKDNIQLIEPYLLTIYNESETRGFNFDKTKLNASGVIYNKLAITTGQIKYEFYHLQKKLNLRNKLKFEANQIQTSILPNPLFYIIEGDVEAWEKS